jgi:hypothetical protein
MTEPNAKATRAGLVSTSAPLGVDHRVRATCRELVRKGFDPNEAANLTAFLSGIPIVRQPWTIDEVSHLLFLRSLAQAGRLGGPMVTVGHHP